MIERRGLVGDVLFTARDVLGLGADLLGLLVVRGLPRLELTQPGFEVTQ